LHRLNRIQRTALSFACLALISAVASTRAFAQSVPPPVEAPAPASPAVRGTSHAVDGVAARIEDDILTESEVRELAAFQKLVDGQSKARADLIRELADQWIIRSEATNAKFPRTSAETVDHAYADFVKQFPSQDEFKQRCRIVGLTEAAVRRMLEQQLYLSRFIEYRFRPAAQVDDKQIETYYRDEFAPQLKMRGATVPLLEDVEETIREVLTQRLISERSNQWLDDAREHLRIDIISQDGGR
jgi:hypothetical protein